MVTSFLVRTDRCCYRWYAEKPLFRIAVFGAGAKKDGPPTDHGSPLPFAEGVVETKLVPSRFWYDNDLRISDEVYEKERSHLRAVRVGRVFQNLEALAPADEQSAVAVPNERNGEVDSGL